MRAGLFHTLILAKDRKLYALGRGRDSAVGVVKVDVPAVEDRSLSAALEELRAVKAIQSVKLVTL